jgi:hypothetical protein
VILRVSVELRYAVPVYVIRHAPSAFCDNRIVTGIAFCGL